MAPARLRAHRRGDGGHGHGHAAGHEGVRARLPAGRGLPRATAGRTTCTTSARRRRTTRTGRCPADAQLAQMRSGDILAIELSIGYHGYAGQALRTIVLDGEPNQLFSDLYDAADEAYRRMRETIRPGATTGDVLRRAEVHRRPGLRDHRRAAARLRHRHPAAVAADRGLPHDADPSGPDARLHAPALHVPEGHDNRAAAQRHHRRREGRRPDGKPGPGHRRRRGVMHAGPPSCCGPDPPPRRSAIGMEAWLELLVVLAALSVGSFVKGITGNRTSAARHPGHGAVHRHRARRDRDVHPGPGLQRVAGVRALQVGRGDPRPADTGRHRGGRHDRGHRAADHPRRALVVPRTGRPDRRLRHPAADQPTGSAQAGAQPLAVATRRPGRGRAQGATGVSVRCCRRTCTASGCPPRPTSSRSPRCS